MKLLVINRCDQCPHLQTITPRYGVTYKCDHEGYSDKPELEIGKGPGMPIKIPDWCPLEDKAEEPKFWQSGKCHCWYDKKSEFWQCECGFKFFSSPDRTQHSEKCGDNGCGKQRVITTTEHKVQDCRHWYNRAEEQTYTSCGKRFGGGRGHSRFCECGKLKTQVARKGKL